jgi:putative transcriptional regulator
MALQYKINVIEALKEKGISTYTLRKDKILSESTIQKLRGGIAVSWENLETLCKLLDCDIGDILEYKKED